MTKQSAAGLALLVALVVGADVSRGGSIDPVVLQARYDEARTREEALLARGSRGAELSRLRREIREVERADFRPSDWTRSRELPRVGLPATAFRSARVARTDPSLAARLASIGSRYRGWGAFWVHDLRTGRMAGWNSDARFPAASMVKLGVLAAALSRAGARPERSPTWYDVRQLTGWSSNLAANRLVSRLGYPAVHEGLRRLGMASSTYPGPYRVGTSRLDAPKPPPQSSWRVTTARDLGRALYAFHAGAAGSRPSQGSLGLPKGAARLALELLVDSSSTKDNRGLLRPFLGGTRVGQKNGWTSAVRATAGIVFARNGPVIVVVLAYRPGLSLAEAQALGRQTLVAAGL
jgi:beta-lactamase class A